MVDRKILPNMINMQNNMRMKKTNNTQMSQIPIHTVDEGLLKIPTMMNMQSQ